MPRLFLLLALPVLLLASSAMADIDLPLIQQSNPDFDWRALAKGKVVWQEFSDREVDDAALIGMVAVRLPADIDSVLEKLHQVQPETDSLLLDVTSDESLRGSLDGFTLRRGEHTDLSWFYRPVADGTFNATREELATLKRVALKSRDGGTGTGERQLVASIEVVVRDLLAARVNEYRAGGLAAISPYDVDGKQIHPGNYLANSLRPMKLMREREQQFYRAFIDYPKVQNNYEHQFFVTTEMEPDSNRPLTSLKHWMVKREDGFTLIGERKFYISHSLDAMHTLILLLEQDKHCYIFLVNQSFTQKVTGMGSFIAHKIGRRKLKQNILPLFQALKASFP